jgi:hypothetical protein
MDELIYSDIFGDLLDRQTTGIIEIRWFDSTSQMAGSEFQGWLERFAAALEQPGRRFALVDTNAFRMDSAQMDTEWRDSYIIPRYNAAGVERFAFHMPPGMPAIGQPAQAEGPAQFPTAYFSSRNDALEWLGAS